MHAVFLTMAPVFHFLIRAVPYETATVSTIGGVLISDLPPVVFVLYFRKDLKLRISYSLSSDSKASRRTLLSFFL